MSRIPLFRGVLPIRNEGLVKDVFAGITLAALGIPEVMGYTKISQTPVVTGLYTLLLPVVAFAVLGASRHLVVAADSATAAILAATLVTVAVPGSAEYVGLTGLVALAVAVMLLLAYVFRLGFLADFLSRSALIGLLTGVGVQVAVGELAGLLGMAKQGHGALAQVASVVERLGEAQVATLALSLAVLALIVGATRLAPNIPGALIAVVGAIAASAAFDFRQHGIAIIGEVPSGLPSLALPALHRAEIYQVLATAASCFVVIIAQSAATSRAYALRYNERADENMDIIGLAGANLAASLTGTFVVNGSPTKTEMVAEAGGRSQVAHLATAVIVLLVLLFLTKPLGLLPSAVLSAIVFMIGVKLIDVRGMRELFGLQREEFFIALATAATVAFVGVMQGIVVAVLLSLIEHVRHTYRPRTRLLTRAAAGLWQAVPVAPGIFAVPGVIAYRFEANLFYANASRFMDEVLTLISVGDPPVRGIVIDASGIDDVDYSAAKTLLQMRTELGRRGVGVACVAASEDLRDELARYGVGVGPAAALFSSVDAAIDALSTNASMSRTI
jgi:sulfate permease, SulP family